MATVESIASLRRLIDDVAAPQTYTDEYLNARLDANENPEAIAAALWREKAAKYATLVDISESGSSRKLSDLRKAALEFAAYYDKANQDLVVVTSSRPRTRAIVRPEPS
jgi:hypothetical protein